VCCDFSGGEAEGLVGERGGKRVGGVTEGRFRVYLKEIWGGGFFPEEGVFTWWVRKGGRKAEYLCETSLLQGGDPVKDGAYEENQQQRKNVDVS